MGYNIEKVKNFNQILLAIAGVIAILFLLSVAAFAVFEMWPEEREPQGIIVTEEAETLNEQGLRKEIISFNNFQLADSADQIFILPVTQASLNEAESIDKTLGLKNSFRYTYKDELVYNNFVVHYGKEDTSFVVFEDRLSLGSYMLTRQGTGKYLLVHGCNTDSNKDRLLNSKDLQNLYLYDLRNKQTKPIVMPPQHTVLQTYEPNRTNIIVCKMGVDRNKNGVFESKIEPTVFMRLNTKTYTLEPFVEQAGLDKLQRILEGGK